MASAAAVGANADMPSLPHDLDADAPVTASVGPASEPVSDSGEHADSPPEGAPANLGEDLEDDDDLFGDEDEDAEPTAPKRRQIDDEELDSGDDEGRADREESLQADDPLELKNLKYMTAELARHAIPAPSDNELYVLKVPRFLSINERVWRHEDFQPPTNDHHATGPPPENFSAYKTAMTTIRWRRSPSNPSELQSNARILRWSDGSLTLQFASNPTEQYELDGKPMAPPQHNPLIPTPTSIQDKRKGTQPQYDASKDSFTYLATVLASQGLIYTTNKCTTGLFVLPSSNTTDASLERLKHNLLAAKSRTKTDSGITMMDSVDDPEEARRKAEAFEKEKMKAEKKRLAAAARDRERADRVMGRSGMRQGGLSVGGLEDDGSGLGGRRMGRGPKPRRQRRDDYSDEEDYRGRTREDEYDEEDDFVARSDEEEEIVDDDEEDVDEGIELSSSRRREETPKRGRAEADEGGEGSPAGRTKRRRVIDDDDE